MASMLKQISDDIFKKAAAEDYEKGAQASIAFMRSHLNDPDGGYFDCPENTDLLRRYITGHELLWSVDSLNEAYSSLKSSLTPSPMAPALTEPVAVVPTVEENLPPWGRLDHARVASMSNTEMKRWMKYPGFTEAVDALNIPDNLIKRGF